MSGYEVRKDNYIKRMGYFLLSLVLCAVGVSFIFKGNIGADPLNVLIQGLFVKLGLSLGMWITSLWLFFLVVAVILGLRPTIATFIDLVFFGMIVDLVVFINRFPEPSSIVMSLIYVVSGLVILSFAVGIYINSRLGAGPNMLFTLAIVKKTGISIRLSKTIGDITMLAIGYFLGGTVGVGTIILAISMGYLFQFFITKVSLPGLPN